MNEQHIHAVARSTSNLIHSELFGAIPLNFLTTGAPHECPYLPDRNLTLEFFTAGAFPIELYIDFMSHGFRRSGTLFYRPVCRTCAQCRQLRVREAAFKASKSQRRVWRKNQDLVVSIGEPRFTPAKLDMYNDYLTFQHDETEPATTHELKRFLYASPVETIEFEYRLQRRLVAVGICDIGSRALSSVYVYFDPAFASRSLGTFTGLFEIDFCRRNRIPFHYFGYYVADCPAMSYKARFTPFELLTDDGSWVQSDKEDATIPKQQTSSRQPGC